MNLTLKIKLILLTLVLPISFLLAGILIGENSFLLGFSFHSLQITIILSLVGFIVGILFNIICYYRKIFGVAIYQTPIPLTLFLIFWLIADTFIGDWLSLFVGILGLLLGLWLNTTLVLPYQFFKIKKRILALLYLFYSFVILGLFMGVPIFNLLLGVFAGNYLAMRIVSYIKNDNFIKKSIHQGALFSAFIILIISLIAGLLAFSDIESYLEICYNITQIQLSSDKFLIFLIVMGILGVIAQYFITYFTANTILDLHKHRKTIR